MLFWQVCKNPLLCRGTFQLTWIISLESFKICYADNTLQSNWSSSRGLSMAPQSVHDSESCIPWSHSKLWSQIHPSSLAARQHQINKVSTRMNKYLIHILKFICAIIWFGIESVSNFSFLILIILPLNIEKILICLCVLPFFYNEWIFLWVCQRGRVG